MLVKPLACLLTAVLFCTVVAFADDEYDSARSPISVVGGETYVEWSALYSGDGDRASAWIQVQNGVEVPALHMAVQARLFNDAGDLVQCTGIQFNETAANYLFAVTRKAISPKNGSYFNQGVMGVLGKEGLSWTGYYPARFEARADLIEALQTEQGGKNYRTNSKGETYGSAILLDVNGLEPALAAAVGEDGVRGYVRMRDLYPALSTVKDAQAYLAALKKDDTIPLYDLNGKEIGRFALEVSATSNDSAFAGMDARAAQKKVGNNPVRITPYMSSEEAQALLDSGYPRNSKGETYGNHLMQNVLGYEPDLTAAVGTKDENGYVRTADLRGPQFQTPEEAAASMENRPKSYRIPLYDSEGNVIGEYEISMGASSNDPEFAGDDLETAREKVAEGIGSKNA